MSAELETTKPPEASPAPAVAADIVPPLAVHSPPPRSRRTGRGLLMRGALYVLFGVLGVLAVRPWEFWPHLFPAKVPPRSHEIVQSNPPSPAAPQKPDRVLSQPLVQLRSSIALVEADGPTGREVIGSAFVLSADGQLVTCLHVANRATSAVVRFHDGSVFDVAGYAAVNPQSDLALLQLAAPPSSLVPIRIAQNPPGQLKPVVAWGHPRGIEFSPFDGKVSRLVKTSELPSHLQKFVRELTGSDTDQTWLQHTARLSEGNSGGPLANEQGEVIGINLWVDRQTDYSYALPISALTALQQNRLPDVQPLERFATAEARLRAETWTTTASKLKQLAAEARALHWQVHEPADYVRLQHLAFAVTLANSPERFTTKAELGERLDELVKEADRVVAQLHAHSWNNGGQIIVLNEYAEKELGRAGAGVVFFGSVQRVVEGKSNEQALLVQLAGFEQTVLVPLAGQLASPAVGSQCLFIGVNDRGRVVRYGDNPLQPVIAPVIIAPVIVPLSR
jgi:S1-C subfamily serine protease